MVIWLASYPRSGNTLVRLVLAQVYGYDTYSLYNDPELRKMGMAEILHQKEFLREDIAKYEKAAKPYFVKTHLLPHADDTNKAIYIMRDGRDALVSHAHYRVDVEGASGFTETLKNLVWRKPLCGGWSNHVHSWLHKMPAPMVFRFEDLLECPIGYVQVALRHLKLPAEPVGGQLPTFEELHEQWPKFFRAGRLGSWRREMDAKTQRKFHVYHKEVLEAVGYR